MRPVWVSTNQQSARSKCSQTAAYARRIEGFGGEPERLRRIETA